MEKFAEELLSHWLLNDEKFMQHLRGTGNQVFHFKSENKTCKNPPFVCDVALESDAEVLKFGVDSVTLEGAFVELGVASGKTINFIAALKPHKKIYGFDSFEGLPEDWGRLPKGTFHSPMPPVLNNVELIPGWFTDTLPRFQQPIAFLHVDCDLYSSTAFALKTLNLQPGTVIVFDEYYNYPGFENHEFKALQDSGLNFEYLAYNIHHEQVVVKLLYINDQSP